jgi:folate-binding protein YgfZ
MALISPLKRMHQEAEASMTAYGPTLARADGTGVSVEVVETFGELEIEYAAIRKSCVVLDLPNRGVVEVTGRDRLEFLNRMLTQELKGLSPFSMKRSFWLNRKGRVDADVRVIDLPHATYLEMDVHAVARTVESLSGYIVMEDVQVRDMTGEVHRLALHGPTASELMQALSLATNGAEASGPVVRDLPPGRVAVVRVESAECVVVRDDTTGETGLEIFVPLEATRAVYEQMLEIGTPTMEGERQGKASGSGEGGSTLRDMLASRIRLKPAGWHAYNIARIEAGTPLYNLDFGPESLPAETGVMMDRVSLTKGCYLGQEVVARMHARGQAKQKLVAIAFEAIRDELGVPKQPTTGMAVLLGDAPKVDSPEHTPGEPIGVITSSTVAPMLGAIPVAFAAMKSAGLTSPGQRVRCMVEGTWVNGVVRETLKFWTP